MTGSKSDEKQFKSVTSRHHDSATTSTGKERLATKKTALASSASTEYPSDTIQEDEQEEDLDRNGESFHDATIGSTVLLKVATGSSTSHSTVPSCTTATQVVENRETFVAKLHDLEIDLGEFESSGSASLVHKTTALTQNSSI